MKGNVKKTVFGEGIDDWPSLLEKILQDLGEGTAPQMLKHAKKQHYFVEGKDKNFSKYVRRSAKLPTLVVDKKGVYRLAKDAKKDFGQSPDERASVAEEETLAERKRKRENDAAFCVFDAYRFPPGEDVMFCGRCGKARMRRENGL